MQPTEQEVINLLKIQKNDNITCIIKSVGDDKFRVNVYQKYYVDGSIIPRQKMITSRYIRGGNTLTDCTL